MKKFISVFKSKSFKWILLLTLLVTSILIILVMLLGTQSGNFVVKVESGDANKSIAITDYDLQVQRYGKNLRFPNFFR